MSWRVADYDGTPTKEAFCPYWRCSAEQNFEMHERVEGGDVQEAEFRSPLEPRPPLLPAEGSGGRTDDAEVAGGDDCVQNTEDEHAEGGGRLGGEPREEGEEEQRDLGIQDVDRQPLDVGIAIGLVGLGVGGAERPDAEDGEVARAEHRERGPGSGDGPEDRGESERRRGRVDEDAAGDAERRVEARSAPLPGPTGEDVRGVRARGEDEGDGRREVDGQRGGVEHTRRPAWGEKAVSLLVGGRVRARVAVGAVLRGVHGDGIDALSPGVQL
jgi:hypothetical protein